MRHNATELKPQSDHWAVSWSGENLPGCMESKVLVQLREDGSQARIVLTPNEAESMAEELKKFAHLVRATNHAQQAEVCADRNGNAVGKIGVTPKWMSEEK